MEAALFTLDIFMLLLLIRAVQLVERSPDLKRNLGLFSFLENKTDEVHKGLGRKGKGKGKGHA